MKFLALLLFLVPFAHGESSGIIRADSSLVDADEQGIPTDRELTLVDPCLVKIQPVPGAAYSFIVWGRNMAQITNPGGDPFKSDSVGTSSVQGGTLTLLTNISPVTVGINDNEGIFEDADGVGFGSQVLVQQVVLNGRSASVLEIEYSYSIKGTDGRVINIYAVEEDNDEVVGFISDSPLRLGERYTFIQRTSTDPKIPYSNIATSYIADEFSSLCVRPTSAPTAKPTPQPTPFPTATPTPPPSAQPTPFPTVQNTPLPTMQPTPRPTVQDTPLPTMQPTPLPTVQPTPRPTPPVCVTSPSNLVCNGSFESNDVPFGGSIDFSSDMVPGWASLTGMICLVENRGGVPAPDGFNYAELDCVAGGPIEGVYQEIPTVAGQPYTLSFMMRARDPSRASLEDEGVNVEWNGIKVQSTSFFATSGGWEMKQATVVGTGGVVRLLFRESASSGASDGSGPYIDNVVLSVGVAPTPAPTPSPTVLATPSPTLAPVCVTSPSNLICNGSFESNDVPFGGSIDFSSDMVPGWESMTGMICLVENRGGVPAPDGFNYAELDCVAGGPIEGVYQEIPTVAGQPYTLSFMMRARDPSRASLEDEGVNVEWNGIKVQSTSFFATSGGWEMKQATVVGTGGVVRLLFRESASSGASDGSGPYIDNVVLSAGVAPTSAPTPSPTVLATPSPTLAPVCVTSPSNLICNGSFELNDIPPGSSIDFAPEAVPGWLSTTAAVCLVNNRDSVAAADGFNYAELDCIAGGRIEGIYQGVPTVFGQPYTLTFMMRARDPSRASLEDEGVNVEWDGFKVQPTSFFATSGGWEMKEATVIGTGSETILKFRESAVTGASDGSGPYIDNVVLKAGPSRKLLRGPQL